MADIFYFLLLYVLAIVIIGGVSAITYFLIFKKYNERINKTKEKDINKAKSRLKYCLKCGEELDKRNICKSCNIKY